MKNTKYLKNVILGPESDVKSAGEVILFSDRMKEANKRNAAYKILRISSANHRYILGKEMKSIQDISNLISDLEYIESKLISIVAGGFVNDEKLSSIPILQDYLKLYSVSEVSLQESRVLMRWLSSLLNLHLYHLCKGAISEVKLLDLNSDLLGDRVHDLMEYERKYYGRIAPSVRAALKRKSITITKNIYCGFDTEYEHVDMSKNKILSAQFAVSSKVLLSIPLVSPYKLQGMNTSTGCEYPISPS